jgi:hypothetical protein
MRLQRWENGPYSADFSLHIPDMRSFVHMHEIVKICPRSPTVWIEPVFRFRTPRPDRLLADGYAHIAEAIDRKRQCVSRFDEFCGDHGTRHHHHSRGYILSLFGDGIDQPS